jgi:hypothetical protein
VATVAEHTFAGLRCTEVADLAPAFVLGALERAESDAVRRHLTECPEAHPEMAELNSVVPALFGAVEPFAPPASLRQRILDAAGGERVSAAQAAGVPDRRREARRAIEPEGTVKGWASIFRRPLWAPLALAAALAVVALGAWNLQLRDEIAGLSAYRNGVVQVLDRAAEPGSQLAVLVSEATGPSGLAAVTADGDVALIMRNLAPTSGTQVYETWVIGGDGTPVPIGHFTVAANGTASFATAQVAVGPGVTVALTLEPGPGATTPTLPIVAAGTAQPS